MQRHSKFESTDGCFDIEGAEKIDNCAPDATSPVPGVVGGDEIVTDHAVLGGSSG